MKRKLFSFLLLIIFGSMIPGIVNGTENSPAYATISDTHSHRTVVAYNSDIDLLFDLRFTSDGLVELSSSGLPIESNEGYKPVFYFDEEIGQYVSSFNGDRMTCIRIPYKGNSEFKNSLLQGFTLEVYSRTTDADGENNMSSVSAQESGGFGIEQTKTGNKTEFWLRDNKGYKKVGSRSVYDIANPQYHHQVFTYDGSKIVAYYNSVFDGETALESQLVLPPNENAHWIAVGGDASTGTHVQSPFKGEIALVRMYNKAVTSEEVNELYSQISKRASLTYIGKLNELLTSTIPTANLSQNIKNVLLEEGFALMHDLKTEDNAIQTFIAKVDQAIGTIITEGLPKFAVISDTHLGRNGAETKVSRALQNLLQRETELDAIFVVGDLTNAGTQPEYDAFKTVFDEEVINKGIPAYYCMGNHDRYNDRGSSNTMFEKTLEQPLNQYVIIKGYPFILISMENQYGKGGYATYAKDFLEEKLKDATKNYPDKPIFVFFHVPVEGTVYGSYEIGGDDSWGSPDLKELCESYPQIIAFAGHSHYPLGDERSIHQDKFTSVNDGNTAYCEVETGFVGGTRPKNNEDVNEGCLVYIEENGDVTIKRLNFTQNIEIAAPWSIKAPHDGTAFIYKDRDGGESPDFNESARVEVINISTKFCEIEFPQATDDDHVQHYVVEAINEAGETVTSFKLFSLFYLNALTPQKLSVIVSDLQPDTEYRICVTAVDAFGNKSVPSIFSDPFTTVAEYIGDIETMLDLRFTPDGIVELSSSGLPIESNEGYNPDFYFDEEIGQYVSSFDGDRMMCFRIPYKGNNAFKNILLQGFTLEVYSRTTDADGENTMSSVSAQESGGFGIEQTKTGDKTEFWLRDDKGYKKVGSLSVYDAANPQYHHQVFTYDGSRIAAYYNSVFNGETALESQLVLPPNEDAHWIAIGGDASTGTHVQAPFKGEIALVRMYNKAATPEDVSAFYSQISKRASLTYIGKLNELLTSTIPASDLSQEAKNELLEEGFALMHNLETGDSAIQVFMAKVNKTITSLNDVKEDNIQIVVKDGRISVIGTDQPYSVYTIDGVVVDASGRLASGVYIIKVGQFKYKILVS